MLNARRARPTPFIDKTMYVCWNAMFVSAYLEASRVLRESDHLGCRAFALKTMDRMLKEVWSERRGFGHRIGGPRLKARSTISLRCSRTSRRLRSHTRSALLQRRA